MNNEAAHDTADSVDTIEIVTELPEDDRHRRAKSKHVSTLGFFKGHLGSFSIQKCDGQGRQLQSSIMYLRIRSLLLTLFKHTCKLSMLNE